MMRIFIAGASGLVGSNCHKYLTSIKGVEVVGSYFSFATPETIFFDTLNLDNAQNFDIQNFKPTHILHAGALTHVDYCEEHPEESYRQTVESTINMVRLAKELNAKLIYISTDYVFDGKEGPYNEIAITNPISLYGRHKLDAEDVIRNGLKDWLILRITNVYGDEIRNKNFVSRLVNACVQNEKLVLKLPIDQYATPVNAIDIAKSLYLLLYNSKSGIYNIAGTDYLNRVQLANKVLNYFPENEVNVIPVLTSDLKQAAPRPLEGGLKSHKLLNEFPDFDFSSVDNYLSMKIRSINEKK